jgi:hypothetical protein
MKQITYLVLLCLLHLFSVGQTINDQTVLEKELHEIYRFDQKYREELSSLPPTSVKSRDLWILQNELDSLNLIRVTKILDSIGLSLISLSLTILHVLPHLW